MTTAKKNAVLAPTEDSFQAFVRLPQGWPALVTIPASLHPCEAAPELMLAVHKKFEAIALVGGKTTYQTFGAEGYKVSEVSSGQLLNVLEKTPGKAIAAAQALIKKVGAAKFRLRVKQHVAERAEALKAPQPEAWVKGPKDEEPVIKTKTKVVGAGKTAGPRIAASAPPEILVWISEHGAEYPLTTHLVRAVATTFPDASVHQIRAALPDLNPSTVGIQVGKARKEAK